MAVRKVLFALGAAGVLLSAPSATQASCAAPTGLTGKWKGDDGGTYRIRAVGNEFWWVGTSPDGGKSWTNVYRGLKNGTQIVGRWADVSGPGGYGAMTLTVVSNNQLRKASGTGSPFGGTKWNRVVTCDDVVLNPA